ncbi:hypothetical protein J6590_034260 [Homalodisca vitripennis]|nr:hypothetical protein J6590_034260 [Homalodisca vitripennis]
MDKLLRATLAASVRRCQKQECKATSNKQNSAKTSSSDTSLTLLRPAARSYTARPRAFTALEHSAITTDNNLRVVKPTRKVAPLCDSKHVPSRQ